MFPFLRKAVTPNVKLILHLGGTGPTAQPERIASCQNYFTLAQGPAAAREIDGTESPGPKDTLLMPPESGFADSGW